MQEPSGDVLREISQRIGRATNNVAEYKALIATLLAAHDLGVQSVAVRLDSELVVRQIRGEYRTKKPDLKPLFRRAQELLKGFQDYTIDHVPRLENRVADALCNKALDQRDV